jgi:hypothetical protein
MATKTYHLHTIAGEILARLQQSAGADLGDFFGFTVAEPTMQRKTGSREV